MNFKLTWKRTVIGGEDLHHDFCADVDGQPIGRIRRIPHGEQKGEWEWNFHLGHSEFRYHEVGGVELTRQTAIDKITAAYADYMSYPADKGGGA